jgi:hypothetical protein
MAYTIATYGAMSISKLDPLYGYVLYDGDYSSEYTELFEVLLFEKFGDKYDGFYECVISNADKRERKKPGELCRFF